MVCVGLRTWRQPEQTRVLTTVYSQNSVYITRGLGSLYVIPFHNVVVRKVCRRVGASANVGLSWLVLAMYSQWHRYTLALNASETK